jgi:hypothetical protein
MTDPLQGQAPPDRYRDKKADRPRAHVRASKESREKSHEREREKKGPIVPEPNHMQPHLMGSLVVAFVVARQDAFQVQVAVLQPLHTRVTVAVCPYAHPLNKDTRKRAAAQKVKTYGSHGRHRASNPTANSTMCADQLKPRGSKGSRSKTYLFTVNKYLAPHLPPAAVGTSSPRSPCPVHLFKLQRPRSTHSNTERCTNQPWRTQIRQVCTHSVLANMKVYLYIYVHTHTHTHTACSRIMRVLGVYGTWSDRSAVHGRARSGIQPRVVRCESYYALPCAHAHHQTSKCLCAGM